MVLNKDGGPRGERAGASGLINPRDSGSRRRRREKGRCNHGYPR